MNKILSLALVLLMMITAAFSVNKMIFGHKIAEVSESKMPEQSDKITVLSDSSFVIHTANISGTTIGYAGPVPLDIYVTNGKISEIKSLPNAETPAFFKRASVILNEWIGKTPQEALTMTVDGKSGATYTSDAIKSNVTAGLDYYIGEDSHTDNSTPLKVWVALAVTLAACIVPLFVTNRYYHIVQLIANVAVLGFWTGQFLDYYAMLKYLSVGFSFPIGLIAVFMLIAAFIYPLFGKPQYYCNQICPLGSAQILMGKVCHFKLKMPVKVIKALNWFRKLLWAALMLLLWADCLTEWMDFELFQAFQLKSASWWIILAALIFIALSAVVSRPYCRFVCPTGSLFKRSENIG